MHDRVQEMRATSSTRTHRHARTFGSFIEFSSARMLACRNRKKPHPSQNDGDVPQFLSALITRSLAPGAPLPFSCALEIPASREPPREDDDEDIGCCHLPFSNIT